MAATTGRFGSRGKPSGGVAEAIKDMFGNNEASLANYTQKNLPFLRPEVSVWPGGLPSSHLSHDEWRSITELLGLTDRQQQIVRCVFDGFDEPSIAKVLGISCHTVHAHLNRLYKKIHVKSRCELIVRMFLAYLFRFPAIGRSNFARAVAFERSAVFESSHG